MCDYLDFVATEPDSAMDALWVKEAESWLDAYDCGELKATPLAGVLAKYGKQK